MSPSEFAAELARPFTDSTLLVGMLVFMGLGLLAGAAGLFGLWLGIIVLPAFCKYLVRVMQARIDGRPVEPAGIELFNPVDSLWALLPVVLAILGGLSVRVVHDAFGLPAAVVLTGVLLTTLPASCGALGLTQSPVAALNPVLLVSLVRRCGPAYAAVPIAAVAAIGGIALLVAVDAPGLLVQVAEVYWLFLWFSMTGAVVAQSGVREEVGIPDATEPGEDRRLARQDRERAAVLNHAYGLFSRGNRNGGMKHIEDFINRMALVGSAIDELDWFFRRMMDWESPEAGLLLGKRYLSQLLDAGNDRRALKVLSRCLLAEPRFRPLPEDRERLARLAATAGRDDLLAQLR